MTERPQRERSQTEQRLTVRRSKGVVARQRASGVRGIALILGMLTGGSLCAGWLGPRWIGWQNPCFAPSPRPPREQAVQNRIRKPKSGARLSISPPTVHRTTTGSSVPHRRRRHRPRRNLVLRRLRRAEAKPATKE